MHKDIGTWLINERERINKITDPIEKQKQLYKLSQRSNLILSHYKIWRQEVFDYFINRGFKIQRNFSSQKLKTKWEETFASSLSTNEKKQIYIESFFWHIFSYEKVICKKNQDARKSFNETDKNIVIAFYQDHDDVLYFENATNLKDIDFDTHQDVYIVDVDFTWTYVVTHEKQQCGPYFYMPKNLIFRSELNEA